MGKMAENPRYQVLSVRMSEEEKDIAARLTADELREVIVAAGREKGKV